MCKVEANRAGDKFQCVRPARHTGSHVGYRIAGDGTYCGAQETWGGTAMKCGHMSGGYRCELDEGHEGLHRSWTERCAWASMDEPACDEWSPQRGAGVTVTLKCIYQKGHECDHADATGYSWSERCAAIGAGTGMRCERRPGHTGAHQAGSHEWMSRDDEHREMLRSFTRADAAEKERDELRRSLKAAQNDLAARITEAQTLRLEVASRREDEEALSQALETADMALKSMQGDRDAWERRAKDELRKGIDTARDMVNEITEQREKNRVLAAELARSPRSGGAGLALAASAVAAVVLTLMLGTERARPEGSVMGRPLGESAVARMTAPVDGSSLRLEPGPARPKAWDEVACLTTAAPMKQGVWTTELGGASAITWRLLFEHGVTKCPRCAKTIRPGRFEQPGEAIEIETDGRQRFKGCIWCLADIADASSQAPAAKKAWR